MLRLSNEELLCFQSITAGPAPFGIVVRPFMESEKEAVIEKAKRLLAEKKILTEEYQLTMEGAAIVRSYELYRNSKIHLILNYLKVALLPSGECIILRQDNILGQDKEGLEMTFADHGALMLSLLKDTAFLRQAEPEEVPPTKWEGIAYDEFSMDVRQRGKGSLMVGEYDDRQPVKERVFYWTENEGYVYNLHRERRKQLTGRQMRIELLKVLKLPERMEELEKRASE